MIGGLAGHQAPITRGDQTPPADPDRDLGGPQPLRTLYQWNLIDFNYDSDGERKAALDSKDFIPENTLPLGLEIWKERVFVTFPRWKPGVPCTLATAPRIPSSGVIDPSPKLQPYPSWNWHRQQGDCSGLTSVFRISADRCGRLWVLDSGQVEALETVPRQVCPPQLIVFNLTNDEVIGRYPIPEMYVRQSSLFTNIVTDMRGGKCDDVHVYFTDVWRFSLIVFRLRDEKFWSFSSHLFYPDPLASDYTVHGINFQWSDGIFGISLTPLKKNGDRTLFFHPMSSYREFVIPASVLRNETAASDTALLARSIRLAGESRGFGGQSSASAIDRKGVMFFNLVARDALGCWDTRKPYKKSTLGIVAHDPEKLIFPNDLKVDHEEKQSVWVLSNRLPIFLYRKLDGKDINFRIMREYVDEAVAGGVCDPRQQYVGPVEFEPECS
ncbi:L-dopachrome tautomerase yellow-h isoform X2 [Arctopsyche grandis]